MASSPASVRRSFSLKTWLTSPSSRRVTMWLQRSAAAMPADSWPRCCRAYRAKYDRRDTSWPGAYSPNTPHSSRGPSRILSTVSGKERRQAARMSLGELLHRDGDGGVPKLDLQRLAPDLPDPREGRMLGQLPQRRARPAHEEASRALAEQGSGHARGSR